MILQSVCVCCSGPLPGAFEVAAPAECAIITRARASIYERGLGIEDVCMHSTIWILYAIESHGHAYCTYARTHCEAIMLRASRMGTIGHCM